ncbi:ABC transporter permease [Micromonospora sp. LOL_015]|uniref:ABC transporter permease n=1 Tax=Micromonospora sp. LOL_015 TaxID=3345416 RepID=UPI003A84BD5D
MTTATIPVPPRPTGPVDRLRWALADGWVVGRANLYHWRRNPGLITQCLMYPVMTAVFGFVFGSAMVVAGGGSYREFLMPGLFGQTMMFGIITTMMVTSSAAAKGVTDRFRTMPMAQTGVAVGRCIADVVTSVFELTILVVCALLVGWRFHQGVGPALGALGLLLLFRFALVWVGIFFGLILPMEAVGAGYVPLIPLTMLANTFVSPTQMPHWLGTIAEWNPVSATVAACRELFGNPGVVGDSWAAQHALLLAFAWPGVILSIFIPLSIWRYRNLER